MNINERIFRCNDDNINELRQKYPNGLRFVVGDTHGQSVTLRDLMEKIKFDPQKDHVFFVGDYNEGGNIYSLMEYLAEHYRAEYNVPGFHLIRGNHEHELYPAYPLENLPDVLVLRGNRLNFYIAHAGMVEKAFHLINDDMAKNPGKSVYAYRLDTHCAEYNGPLRQIIWSRYGLYSQKFRPRQWPTTESLMKKRACIIHGHSPYCFFKQKDRFTYGDVNLFFEKQHIWFSEDLQSFNIDSNVKGRDENGESYRGLACICLEVLEEIAAKNPQKITIKGIRNAQNGVFSVPLRMSDYKTNGQPLTELTNAHPEMKVIAMDESGSLIIEDDSPPVHGIT